MVVDFTLTAPTARRLSRARYALLALSVVSLLPVALNGNAGDCDVYREAVEALFSGRLPYRDATLEYPPYALPFFVLPYVISSDPSAYHRVFAIEMLLVDVAVKALLLSEGKRLLQGWRTLLPCALFILDGWFQMHLYLKRYDLVSAALTVGAVVWLARGRSLTAGMALAAGIGVKLYPVVLLLPMLAAAKNRAWRLAVGVAAGLLPLALLSGFLPWWRFATFHTGRGLQAESLAASIIWWLHRTIGLSASWNKLKTFTEVGGPMAEAVLLPVKSLLACTVIASVTVATLRAFRAPTAGVVRLSRVLLLPLLAFIAFNNVLSPQYAIWFFPLVALAAWEGSVAPVVLLVVATGLIPFFWPSIEYRDGLRILRATLLLIRNGMFVSAWWLLLREPAKPKHSCGLANPNKS